MKLELKKIMENLWQYSELSDGYYYSQSQFDYVYKHLDFDKIYKKTNIYFINIDTSEYFYKNYISNDIINNIYNSSPEGYEWLKDNWGNGVFKLYIYYPDKQKLKTIVNKVINIAFLQGNN